MARFAMVEDATGFVVNVVMLESDSGLAAPSGYTLTPDDPPAASPGGKFVDGKFEPPPGLVPAEQPQPPA